MSKRVRKWASPTNTALTLGVLVTCLWVYWGVGEMFHEGWYAPFEWLFFLLPAGATLILTLVASGWPQVGATLFVTIGLGFGCFVLWQYRPGGGRAAGWTPVNLLSWVPVTLFLALIGGLFYRGRGQGRRRAHYLVAAGVPVLLGLGRRTMWSTTVGCTHARSSPPWAARDTAVCESEAPIVTCAAAP